MAVCWSGSTTSYPCNPWRSQEEASMGVKGGRSGRMNDDFGGGIAFGNIDDTCAIFSSQATVSSQ